MKGQAHRPVNQVKNLSKAERPLLGFFLDLILIALVVLAVSLVPAELLLILFLALLGVAFVFALISKHHH